MKIDVFDIGPHRWSMRVWPKDKIESTEFAVWMTSNYPECFFKKRQSAGDKFYWEIRGTHYGFPTMFKLTWM